MLCVLAGDIQVAQQTEHPLNESIALLLVPNMF